ncbi:MAG: hypothetical protein CM1200mP2_25580 [Planctomycetaceae bacterium]|nr:MAG: hypothetical protein CM1200mP2_25580 [Planctomycetaceae bacterium]
MHLQLCNPDVAGIPAAGRQVKLPGSLGHNALDFQGLLALDRLVDLAAVHSHIAGCLDPSLTLSPRMSTTINEIWSPIIIRSSRFRLSTSIV